MSEIKLIINLGDLSKPATLLIEKVSNAIGIGYEPIRTKRKAEAEIQAEKIKALASIELNEIQQRAIDRMIQQASRKQENIESILAQAAASLDETADVQNLEEDWVAHFLKSVKLSQMLRCNPCGLGFCQVKLQSQAHSLREQ